MEKHKNSKFSIALPLIIVVSIIAGMFLAKYSGFSKGNAFVASTGNTKLDLILDYIEKEYVDSISQEELIEKTIPLILEQLDPHSGYIAAEEFNDVNDPLEGEFEGIGVQFNIQKDTVVIVQVIVGGPSERVNIKAGDRIVKVNDSLIAGTGINSNKVVKLLKGPKNTKVKVGIFRPGSEKLLDFNIVRDKIPFYSIDASYMATDKIGYIKISRFAMTTYEEFTEHAQKLKDKGMTKMILDLRGNGGGIFDAAIMIADEFLDKGKTIVYTQGKASPREDYYSNAGGICVNTELVILLNEESASASEVLAGAIQDNDRGTIVGRRSFGKGLVMSQKQFNDKSAVRLTVSRYYSPTGRCIQKPYTEDIKDYYSEIYQRDFIHEKDSIHFPDSLKFKTPGGKIVYGGGGIMPDVYVAYDTTKYSQLLSDLISKSIMYDFAFDYADKNRPQLAPLNTNTEFKNFFEKNNVFKKFISHIDKKEIKYNANDLSKSEKTIKIRLYSFIVRNIKDDSGFYPLYNEDDETFLKAVEVLK
ncbi:MAG: S41 family peptidase [Bacteroidales bacterium]|nr:S41 family peptidase [Bacteroidales bacterium]